MGLIDNVSVFTKGVGAKAKGNYDVVAMNAQISSIKKEINELYNQIGEAYYKEHANSPEDIVADLVAQVNSKVARIEELNNQIEITKNETAAVQLVASTAVVNDNNKLGRKCKACGASMDDDGLFCPKCGTRNDIEETIEEQQIAKENCCPGCGAEVAEDDMFCGACGYKLK